MDFFPISDHCYSGFFEGRLRVFSFVTAMAREIALLSSFFRNDSCIVQSDGRYCGRCKIDAE